LWSWDWIKLLPSLPKLLTIKLRWANSLARKRTLKTILELKLLEWKSTFMPNTQNSHKCNTCSLQPCLVELGLNKIIAIFAQIIGNTVKMGKELSEEKKLKNYRKA
jgi:hypothetical protein